MPHHQKERSRANKSQPAPTAEQQILLAVQRAQARVSPKWVIEHTGLNKGTVRATMRRMVKSGVLVQEAVGLYRLPHPKTATPPDADPSAQRASGIRLRRKAANIPAPLFAKLMGISIAYLNRIEAGEPLNDDLFFEINDTLDLLEALVRHIRLEQEPSHIVAFSAFTVHAPDEETEAQAATPTPAAKG